MQNSELLNNIISTLKDKTTAILIIAFITIVGASVISFFLGKKGVEMTTINLVAFIWISVVIGIGFKVFDIGK